jgi:hypothetical protein
MSVTCTKDFTLQISSMIWVEDPATWFPCPALDTIPHILTYNGGDVRFEVTVGIGNYPFTFDPCTDCGPGLVWDTSCSVIANGHFGPVSQAGTSRVIWTWDIDSANWTSYLGCLFDATLPGGSSNRVYIEKNGVFERVEQQDSFNTHLVGSMVIDTLIVPGDYLDYKFWLWTGSGGFKHQDVRAIHSWIPTP